MNNAQEVRFQRSDTSVPFREETCFLSAGVTSGAPSSAFVDAQAETTGLGLPPLLQNVRDGVLNRHNSGPFARNRNDAVNAADRTHRQ
jgi:hypothetical protein